MDITEQRIRTVLNVIVICVTLENLYQHYHKHSSFASLTICTDVIQRRAVFYIDEHCREHEQEANLMSLGGLLFNFIVINSHLLIAGMFFLMGVERLLSIVSKLPKITQS